MPWTICRETTHLFAPYVGVVAQWKREAVKATTTRSTSQAIQVLETTLELEPYLVAVP
jgi:hypothetical protein